MEWDKMTNADIRAKMLSMKEEYEAIKNKINAFLVQLDDLDNEYIKALKILNERTKK